MRSPKVQCPYCATLYSKVVDCRWDFQEHTFRRWRKCQSCHRRYSTLEIIDEANPGKPQHIGHSAKSTA